VRSRQLLLAVLVTALAGCEQPPRELTDLRVVDSLYMDPATGDLWTGAIVRHFEDEPEMVQIEGELLEGSWHGDLTVYHPNGRIRYMGSFNRGERCGAWTENADSTDLGSVYEALMREVETMGLYPPCDGAS
jgi:hypothetical protein